MRLDQLAATIGADLIGDPAAEVTGAAGLEEANPGDVSFVANPKYGKFIKTTKATAVIVGATTQRSASPANLLRAENPHFAFRQAVVALYGYRQHPHQGIHPLAFVDPTATVGAGTTIYPFAYVGPNAVVGRDCIIYPGAVLYEGTVVGDRVVIHASTSLGHDGYGFATHRGAHHKIPQIGITKIADDVEIGALCSLERAALGETRIDQGTKLGSSVVIGHGTTVGAHCLLVAQVGIAGSATIGKYNVLAGQVGVAGHITLGDNVRLGAKSGVINDLPEAGDYLGQPAMPIREALRMVGLLPKLAEKLKEIERRLDALDARVEKPETRN